MPNKTDWMNQWLLYRLVYSMTGLVLGMTCVLGGILLFLHGVTGSASWTAKILGGESNMSDAAPGAILFVVGLFIVIATRYHPQVDYEAETTRDPADPNTAEGHDGGSNRERVKVKAKRSAPRRSK
jgi:hypothetical protein